MMWSAAARVARLSTRRILRAQPRFAAPRQLQPLTQFRLFSESSSASQPVSALDVGDSLNESQPVSALDVDLPNEPEAVSALDDDGLDHDDVLKVLEEEVARVATQRAKYLKILQKAAIARLSDEALDLIDQMRAQDIPLDIHTYNAALTACVENIEQFDTLRAQMREDKIPVNISNLAIVCHVCEANGMFEEAFLVQKDLLRLLRTARDTFAADLMESKIQLADFDIIPTSLMYDAIVRHQMQEGNSRRAYAYVLEMIENNVKFAFSTVDAVVEHCEAQGLVKEAHHLTSVVSVDTLLSAQAVDEEGEPLSEEEVDRTRQKQDFYKTMAELQLDLP